ncbi:Asp23/Gls24 family envelope stress response protein [Cellulomonas chengniuliangii]|uniref:Asp23/Gls24 family envelope stress response protein n=1 Tax=Cellulomonas chengniuliangii TaxID=2968084 RepID=UPI001D0E2668|nr:Asp23/Gls24 family envelope stress response protein [Cellulomonas chengniuliangii]MCC2309999.1 Asp23/Gls24 family envelope stress response protein [Cellulomonas chengniuliangii]
MPPAGGPVLPPGGTSPGGVADPGVPAPTQPESPTAQAGSEDPADAADAVRDAVLGVPGITSMHGGPFADVATYLPGRRVTGVRLDPDRTEVYVVVSSDTPIPGVADAVRDAVQQVRPEPVDIYVEGLDIPDA